VLTFDTSTKIYVCTRPADMRKSMDGLAELVRNDLEEEPLSGHLYIFRNRRGDRFKLIYWDRNGYAIWYKRLERGRFSFPPEGPGKVAIGEAEFRFLVGGLSLERVWEARKKTPV